jgi:uncharacterized protein YpmS
MTVVTEKLKDLQKELEDEYKKEVPDEKVIAKLKAKIFGLGLQLTRNDMYLK